MFRLRDLGYSLDRLWHLGDYALTRGSGIAGGVHWADKRSPWNALANKLESIELAEDQFAEEYYEMETE